MAMAPAPSLPSPAPADLLKSGVYVLYRAQQPIFVGAAQCLLSAVAQHRSANGTRRLPEWFPIKSIRFDHFEIFPMPYSSTAPAVAALISSLRPIHNIHSAPVIPLPLPIRRRP